MRLRLPVKEGSAAAARLVEQMDAFLKFVRRQVGDPDLALDVLQDSLIKAMGKAGELRDDGALVPWFYRVLRTTAADAQRRRSAHDRALRGLAAEPPAAGDVLPGAEDAEGPAASALVRGCLEVLLQQMSPAYADIIRRVELAGTDPAAFAKDHRLTAGALKVKRHRARQQLRHLIETVCRCPIDPAADCVCGCG